MNTCNLCNKTFKYNYLLLKHQNRKNSCVLNNNGNIDAAKKHYDYQVNKIYKLNIKTTDTMCGYCDKTFISKSNLNKHMNNNCKTKDTKAEKKLTIFQLPQKLIIQLKRFTTRQQSNPMMRHMGNGKNNALITFPLENLDLSIAENKIKSLTDKYNLYGIVNHSGGLNGGHYTAHCKNLLDKKWYEFNDSSVSYVDDIKELNDSSAYLLFYEKI